MQSKLVNRDAGSYLSKSAMHSMSLGGTERSKSDAISLGGI